MIFGKLLPREGNFFELFNQHANHIVTAAHAFAQLVRNYNDPGLREQYNRDVDAAEAAADTVNREVNRLLHTTFITPIDREQIFSLINTMDDVADLMQNVEDVNKSLASNIALRDAAASTRDAQELHELFKTVEGHYQAKPDAPDGLELSRKSLTLTKKIQDQVGTKDFDGALDSATELSRTCRACHTFYKQS